MKLNPHPSLRAIDPPRDSPPRRWRCTHCKVTGLMDAVMGVACTKVYKPCKYCGQKGECAADCAGMMALLGGASTIEGPGTNKRVYVAGAPLRDQTKCAPCRGYGIYPTNDKKKWPKGAKPDEIGYVFVKCEECGGSGKKANAAEA